MSRSQKKILGESQSRSFREVDLAVQLDDFTLEPEDFSLLAGFEKTPSNPKAKPRALLTQSSFNSKSTAASRHDTRFDTQRSFFKISKKSCTMASNSSTFSNQHPASPPPEIESPILLASPFGSYDCVTPKRNSTGILRKQVERGSGSSHIAEFVELTSAFSTAATQLSEGPLSPISVSGGGKGKVYGRRGPIRKDFIVGQSPARKAVFKTIERSQTEPNENFADLSDASLGTYDISAFEVKFSSSQVVLERTARPKHLINTEISRRQKSTTSNMSSIMEIKSATALDNKNEDFTHLQKDHREFIKTNFKDSNHLRLKTFEKFAFTSIEREDHKDIVPILEDLKTLKEPTGSMYVNDLWSKNMQREILQNCGFLEEKKRLEKYAFYKTMQSNTQKKAHQNTGVLTNKNERVLKDILYRKDQKEDFISKQTQQLISELDMSTTSKKSPTLSSNALSRMLRTTISSDQQRVNEILMKVSRVKTENKHDYKRLQEKLKDHNTWLNKMRRHKTLDDKDEEKLRHLRHLKTLYL